MSPEIRLVIDLDETLVRVNTFRVWTKHAFLFEQPTLRPATPRNVQGFLKLYGARALGQLSHEQMKRCFIGRWGMWVRQNGIEAAIGFNQNFASGIVRKWINRQVLEQAEQFRKELGNSRPPIVATAAPEFYVEPLAKDLGFDFIATQVTDAELSRGHGPNYKENRGGNKLVRLQETIGQETPFIVFTDSVDDLPLIAAAESVVLVGPNRRLVETAKQVGKHVRILP